MLANGRVFLGLVMTRHNVGDGRGIMLPPGRDGDDAAELF
jgi:hypothetical protein